MKNGYSIFILVLTLLITYFIGKGLFAVWDNQVKGYYQTTLFDICRNYEGEGRFENYETTNYKDEKVNGTRFVCDFNN